MFKIGDIICKDESSVPYTVTDIDKVSGPVIKYELTQGNFIFWDYCIGWKKLVTADEALRYGEVLTNDDIAKREDETSYVKNCIVTQIRYKYIRIRIIRYDNRIFYHKMVNGEVVEFKELTT